MTKQLKEPWFKVVDKKTGKESLAKKSYAKKLSKDGGHKIVGKEGDKGFKQTNNISR